MILYGYKSVSSALPFQVQDAIFDNGFITLALIDYVINLAIPLRWGIYFFVAFDDFRNILFIQKVQHQMEKNCKS